MEKYLAAAERIAEEAIVTDPSQFVKSQCHDPQAAQRRRLGQLRQRTPPLDDLLGRQRLRRVRFPPRRASTSLRVDARAQHAGDEPAADGAAARRRAAQAFRRQRRPSSAARYEIKSRMPGGKQPPQRPLPQRLLRSRQPKTRERRDRESDHRRASRSTARSIVRPEDYPRVAPQAR